MGLYTSIVRPLLFRLPPENAQKLAEAILALTPLWTAARPLLRVNDHRLHTESGGIALPNPVGLAAGYDKDARVVAGMAGLGFGYIVIGTVVLDPREGNPRPRLVRNPAEGALMNSLGFPSQGLERVLANLQRAHGVKTPLIASVSGLSLDEFVGCYRAIQPLVSGVELNISSPNTEGIRVYQEPEKLDVLLAALAPLKEKPLFIKLPPYFDDSQRGRVMELVAVAVGRSVEGVTAVNTWPREDSRLAVGRGGLSGRPLFPHMLRIVEEIRGHVGSGLAINACGGISTGDDALAALWAGANTVQLYTGFVYRGPGVARGINRCLLRFMEEHGIPSAGEITALSARERG